MTNRVIIFEEGKKIDLEETLYRRGLLDFSLSKCSSYEEMVKFAKENRADNFLILCKNKHIDGLIEELNTSADVLSLVFEQAVKIQGEGKILIVPAELEIEKFLDEFEPIKQVQACGIFGKSANAVAEKFEGFGVSYKIITKSAFLHTVYYSKPLDEMILNNAFGESVFAFSNEPLQESCAKVLNGKTVCVAESVTAGLVTSKLNSAFPVKSGKILLSQADYDAIKMDEIFIEEHGYSKELAYEVAKKLLAFCDIALAVIDDKNGKVFVAVGSKQQIHVFSSVFEGEGDTLESISQFALFRLYRFLKEN